MVEAFAVASGKGGTGKTTSTLALGMALAEEYDVTVVDADMGMANLLFHADLEAVETTLHDVLVAGGAPVEAAVYERHGMRVVPCGTSLADFEAADPTRLREVVATLAADTDVILLDSAATLSSRAAVLPIVLADRVVVVLEPTIPSLSDGLKVQEYASSYGTETAGVLYNKVSDSDNLASVSERAEQYFDGPRLAAIPESETVRAATATEEPLLAYDRTSGAALAYETAAAALSINEHDPASLAKRARSAIQPDQPANPDSIPLSP